MAQVKPIGDSHETLSFRMTAAEAEALRSGASGRRESISRFVRRAVEELLHPSRPPSITFQIGSPNAHIQVCLPTNYVPPTLTVAAPTVVEWR